MLGSLYNARVRMKKLLAAMVLWMALSTVAFAQVRNATVTYTYLSIQLRGYRLGDEFLLPLDRIAELGWSASRSSSSTKLTAEGKTFPIAVQTAEGQPCLPFREVLKKIGGTSEWMPGGYDALEATSLVSKISVQSGELRIDSGLKVRPTISLMGSGDPKVVLDLEGASIDGTTQLDLDSSAKVTQYRQNTVRITLNFRFDPILPEKSFGSTSSISWNFRGGKVATTPKAPEPKATEPKTTEPKTQPQVQPQNPTPDKAEPAIVGVRRINEDETTTLLEFNIGRPAWKGIATVRRPARDVVEIAIPTFEGKLGEIPNELSSYVRDVSMRQDTGLTILSLKLKSRMGTDLNPTSEGFQLTLIHPVGNGSLKGKLIVIDAGHGGKFPGTGNGEYTEKTLSLATAKAVKRALEAEGATVIMTRESDKHFRDDLADDLIYRANVANSNNADIFLSFHYDDSGSKNTTPPSGTKSIYHGGREPDKYLAECIQEYIKAEGLLPNLGAVNDRKFAKNEGFSVLRNSKMPAILMECAFVRNPNDRKHILTEAFRDNIANCVVKGLKMYFGQK